MTKPNRAERCARTYPEARSLAARHGMAFENPSHGCYQLRWGPGWITNMYPRHNGINPRMYHDPHHQGPFLRLPEKWTLLEAVEAAVRTCRQCLEAAKDQGHDEGYEKACAEVRAEAEEREAVDAKAKATTQC